MQRGIAFTNDLPAYTGTGCPWPSAGSPGFRSEKDNTVSLFNGNLNTSKISLFYTFNSAGISVPPLFMTCNDASDAHEGYSFEGWQQGVYWRGNKMDNLARGMILKNGGVIGQQGTQAGAPSDNEWLGAAFTSTNYGIYTFSSQAAASPIVRRTSPSQFDPPNLTGNQPALSYAGGNGLISYTGTSTFSCGVIYTVMPTIPFPNGEDYDSENLLYMAQMAIYNSLNYNSDLLTDPDCYDFYSLFDGSTMTTLADIELAIGEGNYAEAETLLGGLVPGELNDIEQNYYKFYDLFFQYHNSGELDGDEIEELTSLCVLCPGTDGVCIVQARALYQIVIGEPYEAEPCAGDEGSRRAFFNKSASLANANLSVDIYPNPTTGQVTVRFNKKADGKKVVVSDLSGRKIVQRELIGESTSFHLNFGLEPGVYFFTISNIHETVSKKVIVTE